MGVEDLADLLELRSGKDEEKRLQQRVSSEEPRSKEFGLEVFRYHLFLPDQIPELAYSPDFRYRHRKLLR